MSVCLDLYIYIYSHVNARTSNPLASYMETIKSDDDSGHWKESLLGEVFWEEQERLNRPNEELVEASQYPQACIQLSSLTATARSLTLHKRFPFNLSEGSASRQQVPPKTRRRFSTSDAWSLRAFSLSTVDLSQDNSNRSLHQFHLPSPAKLFRRAGSLLRSSFKMPKEKNTTKSDLPTSAQKDLGTPARPLVGFDSGTRWDRVSSDKELLDIRFSLVNRSEPGIGSSEKRREKDTLDIEQMAPLCDFRNLRVLKITGMRQSYQKYIWRTAWLNLNLEELELGMALAPRIRASSAGNWTEWPLIRGEWKFEVSVCSDPVYQ